MQRKWNRVQGQKKSGTLLPVKKNCRALAAEGEGKICTENKKQPEYHCLINPFRNKYLEVCVVAKIIFGNVGFVFNSS